VIVGAILGVIAMSVKSAADIIWDGVSIPTFDHCLCVSILVDESEAVGRAQGWAKSFDALPEDAVLRVTIDGSVRLFQVSET
jgi:hypothetical protein